jgi:hypothetical protein
VFAVSILVGYFKAHARRVFAELHGEDPVDLLTATINTFLREHDGQWEGAATELFDVLCERGSEGLLGSPSKLAAKVLAISTRSKALEARRGWRGKCRVLRLQLTEKVVGSVGGVGEEASVTDTTNTSFEGSAKKPATIARGSDGTPPLLSSEEWEEVE